MFRSVSDLKYDPTDGGASLPGFWSAVALLRQTGLQHRISEKDHRNVINIYNITMILIFSNFNALSAPNRIASKQLKIKTVS